MIIAATGDVLTRRIPNSLVLTIALLFFPLAWIGGMPTAAIILHAGCGAGLLALGFVVFSFGFFGGGDAKLLAAAGIWFGLEGLAFFLTMTALTGGLLALTMFIWSAIAFEIKLRDSALSRSIEQFRPSVPYGYAISAGAILAYPQSWSLSLAL